MIKLAAVVLATTCLLQAPSDKPRISVNDLAWLQGCWEGRDGTSVVTEQWMKPSGGCMLAMSRTVKGERTVTYEFIRVWQDEAGAIYFTARPSSQPEASFKLVGASAREVVFENPEHDFPQRIVYRLADDGGLMARIEGTKDGKARAFDYPMRRARCE
jgi:hypothetical protein